MKRRSLLPTISPRVRVSNASLVEGSGISDRMTNSKDPSQCRWGILGCGLEAAEFVAEIQASKKASTSAIRHSIVAISSNNLKTSQAFLTSHFPPESQTQLEAFGTSTELHAHPRIDAIFICGPQPSKFQEATSALLGEKAVLLYKPIAMTLTEVKSLCELAKRGKSKWLGAIMRNGSANKQGYLWAADECALGITDDKCESEKLPWSEMLSLLELLDEIRIEKNSFSTSSSPKKQSIDESQASTDSANSRRLGNYSNDSTGGASDDANSSITNSVLRSRNHELAHMLRQKEARIAFLEKQNGLPSSASSSIDRPPRKIPIRSRSSLPAPGAASLSPLLGGSGNLGRTNSFTSTRNSQSPQAGEKNLPFSDVANTADTANSNAGMSGRRRRKDANTNNLTQWTPEQIDASTTENGNANHLGLETVPEKALESPKAATLGEGFLSPTIASENRRVANALGTLGSPMTSSVSAFGTPESMVSGTRGSSKVIESLTTELHASRMALDEIKGHLRTSQKTISTLQKSLDETRASLQRSRSENEASQQIIARKDRQQFEILERARKAETNAKELGKSSREWGTRVRQIEAELGEERILKQRAEMQYDAIAASWKQTREAWEKEMKELRMTHGETSKRNRETLAELEKRYREIDDEGNILRGTFAELERERRRAAEYVVEPVQKLLEELHLYEESCARQQTNVEEVQNEINRIKILMRSHKQ